MRVQALALRASAGSRPSLCDGHVDRARRWRVARRVGDAHRRTHEPNDRVRHVCAPRSGFVPNTGARAARRVCDWNGRRSAWMTDRRRASPASFASASRLGSAASICRSSKARSAERRRPADRRADASCSTRARLRREAKLLAETFALRPELLALANDDTIVCRCEDVRFGELDRSWTFRQAKLYTRVGMGPCQGRICGAALECL